MEALMLEEDRAAKRRAHLEGWLLPVLGVLTLLGGWALVTESGLVPENFLPSPALVFKEMLTLTHEPYSGALLQEHLLASLRKFAIAYVLGVIVGVPLGLLMGRFRIMEWAFGPVIEALRFVPPIAWVPFSILWLGTGFMSPTVVIFSGVFSSCVVNAYSGARQIDKPLLEAAQMLGASRWLTLTEVLFPAALPQIVAGMRIGAGFGWQSLIGAELIVGSTGLGYMIIQGESNLAAHVVVVGMITIGVVGALIDYVMRRVEQRIRRNWRN
ncbi:MAG TPA: ABC transporter permease [Burkholderiaceae bacterium]|jgi:NitT/TauT family transport system permease protein|nr:ABC transporter permease [Burkholderiaceae bacterium]